MSSISPPRNSLGELAAAVAFAIAFAAAPLIAQATVASPTSAKPSLQSTSICDLMLVADRKGASHSGKLGVSMGAVYEAFARLEKGHTEEDRRAARAMSKSLREGSATFWDSAAGHCQTLLPLGTQAAN